MSVTFTSDAASQTWSAREPCLCAQGSQSFSEALLDDVSPTIEDDLAAHARPDCPRCGGRGIEGVEQDDGPILHWSNENAAVMFRVLGVDPHVHGLTLTDARRAAIRARARRDLSAFVRADEVLHGRPRELEDGVVELCPARGWSRGLDAADIRERVEAFAEFVEEVGRRGGTRIRWG